MCVGAYHLQVCPTKEGLISYCVAAQVRQIRLSGLPELNTYSVIDLSQLMQSTCVVLCSLIIGMLALSRMTVIAHNHVKNTILSCYKNGFIVRGIVLGLSPFPFQCLSV